MPLETATYISDLVVTNPAVGDGIKQGDDHLRLIKSTLQNTFSGVTGEVTVTHGDLNNGVVPVGGIILWSGSIASIPSNWELCDGTSGTPDLRDRFVLGAGSTYTPGTTGGSYTTTSGGAHTHGGVTGSTAGTFDAVLGEGLEFTPTHTHTISSDGAHTHSAQPPYYALAYIMRTA